MQKCEYVFDKSSAPAFAFTKTLKAILSDTNLPFNYIHLIKSNRIIVFAFVEQDMTD